jgi:hypothetical protein
MTMTDERKKPGFAFCATIVAAVVVGYFALLGPCCWISSRTGWGAGAVSRIYQPVIRLLAPDADGEPGWLLKGLLWYSEAGAKHGWYWLPDGGSASDLMENDGLPNQGPANWLWMEIEWESSGIQML